MVIVNVSSAIRVLPKLYKIDNVVTKVYTTGKSKINLEKKLPPVVIEPRTFGLYINTMLIELS